MPDPEYYVVEWSGGGGFGHYAWQLADGVAHHLPVTALLTRRGHELDGLGGAHVTIGMWRRPSGRIGGRARRAVIAGQWLAGWLRVCAFVLRRTRRCRVIVHVQAADRLPELPMLVWARLCGARVLVTAHNVVPHDAGRYRRAVQRVLVTVPDGYLVHTEDARRQVCAMGVPAARVRVVPHGPALRLVDGIRSPSPGPRAAVRLINVGMLRPYKGLGTVSAIARRVLERQPDTEFRLAGRTDSPAALADLVSALPEGRVSTRLEYLPLPDLVGELASADVMVLAHRSSSESGIAHLALAAGVAVVGPATGPIARLLGGEPGWLYPPDDVEGAVDRVDLLARQVRADAAAVRRRARALALAVPGWSEIGRTHVDFARGLTRRRLRRSARRGAPA